MTDEIPVETTTTTIVETPIEFAPVSPVEAPVVPEPSLAPVESEPVADPGQAIQPIDVDVKKHHVLSHLEDEAKDVFGYLGIGDKGLEEVFEWVAKRLP